MNKSILYEERDNVGIITLNREKVLNAWNKEMRIKICKIFNKIKKSNIKYNDDVLSFDDMVLNEKQIQALSNLTNINKNLQPQPKTYNIRTTDDGKDTTIEVSYNS